MGSYWAPTCFLIPPHVTIVPNSEYRGASWHAGLGVPIRVLHLVGHVGIPKIMGFRAYGASAVKPILFGVGTMTYAPGRLHDNSANSARHAGMQP